MSTKPPIPKRGEVWLVNFDPTLGTEIKKTRPAVVVSSDGVGILPIRVVVPITKWKDAFAGNCWHVKIEPGAANGLTYVSAVDALQIRGVDTERFVKRLGMLSPTTLDEIAAAIAIVVEYE
ncbi:MAG: type II toxin-antitoxin system PemK/MazF family toxin [Armatimonadota bacterium]|nr:type II toxin-antitoxin system PemK/MazF family toxin [Armatimonadota bacterium]